MITPVAARSTRDVVTATGPDTVAFLQGQLSQDIARLATGESAWSFLLQPQGKVDAWLRVLRVGPQEVRLDVDAGYGAPVLARLQRFKLRTKCELELSETVPMLAVRGTLEDVLPGETALPAGWPGISGVDVLGHDEADELGSGIDSIDADALEALRIRCGVPRMGAELTESTIPAEVGQWVIDASVSFTKGCFTGQELVARIDSRGGNVPKLLRGIVSNEPLEVGAEVTVGDKVVGRVTSAAGNQALAFIHRSVLTPSMATVEADPVEIRDLPLPE